ncbi:MAG: MarR family transcriptional regulator [delta proteobacterium ML8_F1]|nr:MAG: MarR family transcriptional regulator [delta proteobacterium ML8_F1]
MENLEVVLNVLEASEEPLKAGEIAERAELDKGEVDKIIKQLKKEEKIESPKRCYYTAK